jgi:RNA polymerase sporulation-specific sigma factor
LSDYTRMNDIAPLAQAGDPDAYDELIRLAYTLVGWIIKDRCLYLPRDSSSFEDLCQEGMIGVIEAVRDWDPAKVALWTSFAILCAERKLFTIVKNANRQMRQGQNEAWSLDKPQLNNKGEEVEGSRLDRLRLRDSSGMGVDPADAGTSNDVPALLEALQEGNSPLQRHAFMACMVRGQTYEVAAAEIGRHRKSIDNAIQRLKVRLTQKVAELATDQRFSPETRYLLGQVAEGRSTTQWRSKRAPHVA